MSPDQTTIIYAYFNILLKNMTDDNGSIKYPTSPNNNSRLNPSSSSNLNIPMLIECGIATFGLVAVSINASIFLTLRAKDPIYKFLLIEAILDFFYLLGLVGVTYFECGTPCSVQSSSYIAQLYSLVIVDYLTSSIAVNNISIEIFLSLQRLFTISNRPFLQTMPFAPTIVGINLMALVYYLPVMFLKRISETNANTTMVDSTYELVLTDFGQSRFGEVVPAILSLLRLILVTVCLFSINVTVLIKFKRHISQKNKMFVIKTASGKLSESD
jgi:hypothetical protein